MCVRALHEVFLLSFVCLLISLSVWVIICRYCRRAKSVFKELNMAPHVVELDERGLFKNTLLIFSYSTRK